MTGHDHLRTWLAVRDAVPWHEARAVDLPEVCPLVPIRDGAVHDVHVWDRPRSPLRADQLLRALARARADAASGVGLTFGRLRTWQRDVLGVPHVPFRTRTAFAKAGRERYGSGPHLRGRFEACLAQSDDPALPLTARTALAYLDVCFFHPFSDGNARSAFVTLDFLLASAGITLDQVGPLRRVQRRADDPEGALALADLLAALIENTHRRAVRSPPPAGSR